jgi:predicted metal-dependent hydrolase
VTRPAAEHPDAEAVTAFKRVVREWATTLKVRPGQVRVQVMTRKWGSCSRAGRVSFAAALLGEPADFQRYVIVHELLHLRVANHGRLFQSYLSAYVPEWRTFASMGEPRSALMRS